MKCTILAAHIAGDARTWHSRLDEAIQDTRELLKPTFKQRVPVVRVQQETQTSVFHDIATLKQGNKSLRNYLEESFNLLRRLKDYRSMGEPDLSQNVISGLADQGLRLA